MPDRAPHQAANPAGSSRTGRFPSTPTTIGIELRAPTANSTHPVALLILIQPAGQQKTDAGSEGYSCVANQNDIGDREASCFMVLVMLQPGRRWRSPSLKGIPDDTDRRCA